VVTSAPSPTTLMVLRASSASLSSWTGQCAACVGMGNALASVVDTTLPCLCSMTADELDCVKKIDESRMRRIARGAGVFYEEVDMLIKMHKQYGKMFSSMGKSGLMKGNDANIMQQMQRNPAAMMQQLQRGMAGMDPRMLSTIGGAGQSQCEGRARVAAQCAVCAAVPVLSRRGDLAASPAGCCCCRGISHHIISCRVVSCRLVPCRVVSCRLVSSRATNCWAHWWLRGAMTVAARVAAGGMMNMMRQMSGLGGGGAGGPGMEEIQAMVKNMGLGGAGGGGAAKGRRRK
jgi:hypothetical protein